MEPDSSELLKDSLKENISNEETAKLQFEKNPPMKPLSKSAMKKFFKFLIIANKRLRKQHNPLVVHQPSIKEMRSRMENIKKAIDQRTPKKDEASKKILPKIELKPNEKKEQVPKRVMEEKKVEKVPKNSELAKKVKRNTRIIKRKGKTHILSKELLAKIEALGKKTLEGTKRETVKEKKKHPKKAEQKKPEAKKESKSKEAKEKELPKKPIHPDPEFDKRSRAILDIKSIIFDLEKKHKEIVEKNEHHPLLLKRIEEKINFLKRRISDLEDGRHDYERQA